MKKILLVIAAVIVIAVFGAYNQPETKKNDAARIAAPSATKTPKSIGVADETDAAPDCDGINIVSDCTVDGINYARYVYHPATPEKTRTETTTTYKEELVDYCTLCRDGTFSPSCATGRGACSHHGGVAQWNAPRYRKVPVTNTEVIVEKPAQEAYYEKVVKQ